MSLTNVFGGGALYPADVAYRALTLSANLTLTWPAFTTDTSTLAARTMDVTATAAGLSLYMPPANQVSTGYDLLISNRGVNAFSVVANGGTTIVTVAPGLSKYIQVVDNSSMNGAWNLISFGAVTSAADAAALAGYGVEASGATLQASRPVTTFSANMTVGASDRAKTYVWTGGSGTQTLPAVATLGATFAYSLRNQGTGALTVAANGAEMIDGAASIVLQPTESADIHAGVGNWYTVGRGRSVAFNFTLLVKSITGGTVTLTSTEAANTVQRYTGTLTSNASIVLPSVVQVYYVSNQTAGAFTVTFKTSGVGTSISVPSGQNAVLFCDGLNVINTSTTVSGLTSLLLAQGSATTPSIGYSGDSSTGVYQPSAGQVAITLSGTQGALFTSTGLTLAGALAATTGAFSGLVTASTAPTLPGHLANKAYVDGVVAGGGYLPLTGGTLTGLVHSTSGEALRVDASGGYISGFNTGGTTRTGYLQFNAGSTVQLTAEAPATSGILLSTPGGSLALGASGAVTVSGPSTFSNAVSVAATAANPPITVTVTNTGSNGAQLRLAGNGATPNKTLRALSGKFEVVNDAYTLVIFSVADNGAVVMSGAATAPTFNGLLATANISQFTNDSNYATGGSGAVVPTGVAYSGSFTFNNTGGLVWSRVGNTVAFSGTLSLNVTGAGPCTAQLTLPVASNFTAYSDAGGVASSMFGGGYVYADVTNKRLLVAFNPATTGPSINVGYSGTYIVR